MKLHIARSLAVAAVAAAMVVTAVGVAPVATAATVTSVRTLGSATLNPGQSRTLAWTANSDIYQVNIAAVRSSDPEVSCSTEVTKQWYRFSAGGARQFLFTYKNIDSEACRTTPYLAIIRADRSGSTGTIKAGSSKSWHWNNADMDDLVYFVGATPLEPESGRCELQVTWKNRTLPDGEREFVWTVRNNGTVACSGTWRLGWLPVELRVPFPADDPPSEPGTQRGLIGPVTTPYRIYLYNLLLEPTSDGNCVWGPWSQQMLGDPNNPMADTRDHIEYRNIGSVACVLRGVTYVYIE